MTMNRSSVVTAAFLLALGLACGGLDPAAFQPPAPPPAEWQGTWEGEGLTVVIQPDGMVKVEHSGATTSSVQMPGRGFEPDAITLGIGPIASRYELQQGPRAENGVWTMTFEGVVLTRTGEAQVDRLPELQLDLPAEPQAAPEPPVTP
jgi:hypothetical protein